MKGIHPIALAPLLLVGLTQSSQHISASAESIGVKPQVGNDEKVAASQTETRPTASWRDSETAIALPTGRHISTLQGTEQVDSASLLAEEGRSTWGWERHNCLPRTAAWPIRDHAPV